MAVLCRNLSSDTANTEFMGNTPLKFYRENIRIMKVGCIIFCYLLIQKISHSTRDCTVDFWTITMSATSSACYCTDRINVTAFLYLVLHLAHKVTCYFQLFSLFLVSVLRTSINVLSKSKSKNYVTLTKLFLSVQLHTLG